jgi:hypothetical protein
LTELRIPLLLRPRAGGSGESEQDMRGTTSGSMIVGLLAAAFATAANAQLLKCIGKDGHVEYAAQCPAGTKPQTTGIRNTPAPAPGGGAAPGGKSLAERDADFRKRQAEQAEAQAKGAKKDEEEASRQRACADARAYLKSLQDGNRVFKVDPRTGERAYLEDSQYAGEMAAAQKSVAANCK